MVGVATEGSPGRRVLKMAVTIKRVTLWRSEVENKPGMLAQTLKPLADAGSSLQVVMGYRIPGEPTRAAIELSPVSGKKSEAAAKAGGLDRSSIPTLLAIGDDRPGLGSEIAEAIADAGINVTFLVVQVIGRRYSAVYGFETEEEARIATSLIKKVSKPRRR
jgi:hypothetical protein